MVEGTIQGFGGLQFGKGIEIADREKSFDHRAN